MTDFRTFWNSLDWSVLTDLLLSVIPALICITLHELAHGYTAYLLGDDTAKNAGRLTLNPVRHIDWLGLVMMVTFHFGWAKPVPVDMRRFRKLSPKAGMAVTAAAGPLCNLLIAVVFLFAFGLLYVPLLRAGTALAYSVLETLVVTAQLSLYLALFNILPIPPLDGSKVLFSFLSGETYDKLMRYERYGMIVLVAVIFLSSRLAVNPLSAVTGWVFDKLFFIARWGNTITI